jgi:5-methylcytosine-specific restriction endonuclease McrA
MAKRKKKKANKEQPYPNPQAIKGALRRLMSRHPEIIKLRNKCVSKTKKGPRGGKMYVCSLCKKAVSGNKLNVDHLIPVIEIGKTLQDYTYDELVERIFCPIKNLQCICTDCHNKKSSEERKQRKDCKI